MARSKNWLVTPSTWRGGSRTSTSGSGMSRIRSLASKFSVSSVGSMGRTSARGIGVTNQYDRKTVYYKKRMPRRKRRGWVKFSKKVRSVAFKDYGTNTIVRNEQQAAIAVAGTQGIYYVSLYGKDGSDGSLPTNYTGTGSSDLKDIYLNDLNALQTTKFQFKTAILDMTVLNRSTTEVAGANLGLEVDVYEIGYRKVASAPNPASMLTQNQASLINPGNPTLALIDRGVTPFDLPSVLSRYGIIIYKKTKYFLADEQSFTYQYRMNKRVGWQKDFIDDGNDDFMIAGVTRSILVVFKGLPNPNNNVTPQIDVGVTRKYLYKELDVSNDGNNRI